MTDEAITAQIRATINAEVSEQITPLQAQFDSLTVERDSLQSFLASANSQITDLTSERDTAIAERDAARTQFDELNNGVDAEQARIRGNHQ